MLTSGAPISIASRVRWRSARRGDSQAGGGTAAAPDTYPLACNWDQVGDGGLQRSVIWQPPRVLFPCPTCKGTGQYVGLIEVGACKTYGGRKVVAG